MTRPAGGGRQTPSAPLALTMGEPAGIGGEIAIKAWHAARRNGPGDAAAGDGTRPRFFVIDDPVRLRARSEEHTSELH